MTNNRYTTATPGVERTLKSTACKRPDEVPKELEHRKKDGEVIHWEFSGPGLPVDDVGEPGDVWIDSTPGAYGLWSMDLSYTWTPWKGLHEKEKSSETGNLEWVFHSKHPYLDTRHLWVRARGVVWLTRKEVIKDISTRQLSTSHGFPISASFFISEFLDSVGRNNPRKRAPNDVPNGVVTKRARIDQGEGAPTTHYGPIIISLSEEPIRAAAEDQEQSVANESESASGVLAQLNSALAMNLAEGSGASAAESDSTNRQLKIRDAQALPPRKKRSQLPPALLVSSSGMGPSPDTVPPADADASQKGASASGSGVYQTLLRRHSFLLEAEVAKLRAENKTVLSDNCSLKADAEKLVQGLATSQSKLELAETSLVDVTKERAALEERYVTLQEQLAASAQSLARSLELQQSTEISLRDATDKVAALDDQMGAVQAENAQLSQRNDSQRTELHGLQDYIKKIIKDNNALQLEVKRLHESHVLEHGELTIDKAPGIFRALASLMEAETKKSTAMANELVSTKQELDETRKDRDNATQLARNTEAELVSLQSVQPLLHEVLSKFRRSSS